MKNATIGINRNFFYDFSNELEPASRQEKPHGDGKTLVECVFDSGEGDFILLTHGHGMFELNGIETEKICKHYVSPTSFRYGLPVSFSGKRNKVTVLLDEARIDVFDLNLVPAEASHRSATNHIEGIPIPSSPKIVPSKKVYDIGAYTPGVGRECSPGRFGFLKGDGVLDCAMPELGVIDKRYVSSHPKYQKAYRWGYATRPDQLPDGPQVKVNHLSVNWGTPEFNCTYSLASPGIITESDAGEVKLRELEFAGNYQYMMTAGRIASLDAPDPNMKQNWILLFGSTEFPDLPLLIVLDKKPRDIEIKRNAYGRLSEIVFHGNQLMITATPFGMEFFDPIAPDDDAMIERLAMRAVFWSRALLAYPVDVVEYFRNDHEKRQTSIIQRFSYRHISDEWGTEPLETAPVPPAFSLSGSDCSTYVDFKFPTKYGYLMGELGAESEYSISMMPTARKFPLKSTNSKIPDLLRDGLDDYFAFHEKFPATKQPYPYAGALMESYAFASTMMNFMDDDDRAKFARFTGERLKVSCDGNHQYDYPVIDWGYMMRTRPDKEEVLKLYQSPDMKHMKLWNWYERTEPYTGVKYHICYLNVGLFSSGTIKEGTPAEVAALQLPLIENDWGVGLTFYYMYLCALASGEFTPIKESWYLIKSVFSFFDKMCDWACMGTGYSDNAITWVEGANYGAFTAYVNMAEAIGAKADYEYGVYLAAKQFTLRSAIFRAAQHYFHRWFGVEPWYICKGFREEQDARFGFTHVPMTSETNSPKAMTENRNYHSSFYGMTTEGIYPELFEGLRELLPEDHENVMNHFRNDLPTVDKANWIGVWCALQVRASMLTNDALDPAIPKETVLASIADAEQHDSLMNEWRGIHIFSRYLPKNWFKCQILAWLEMREHPLWLEHWESLRVKKAEWTGGKSVIAVALTSNASGRLVIGTRGAISKATLNGEEIDVKTLGEAKAELTLPESGTIEIII